VICITDASLNFFYYIAVSAAEGTEQTENVFSYMGIENYESIRGGEDDKVYR